jgi:hypothetical protein
VLGLVVATAIGTASAAAASTEQFVLPPGATASTVQPALPPGAMVEPVAAPTGEFSLPPGASVEPVAAPGEPRAVPAVPVGSSPAVEIPGGLDWADAGIGAGIAFGGMLLLGGALALLLVRRSGQRNGLVTH